MRSRLRDGHLSGVRVSACHWIRGDVIRLFRRSVLGSLVVAVAWLSFPGEGAGLTLTCSDLRAQIFDGIPGTARLLGSSTGGCPERAAATHSNLEALSNAQIELSATSLRHQHVVDIQASATFRVSISEAFLSLVVPANAESMELTVSGVVDPLRYSSVLQLINSADGTHLLLVAGSPILAGEPSLWPTSDGSLVSGALPLAPGSAYQVYSRLVSYGEVDNSFTLSFSAVPEPSSLVSMLLGLASLLAMQMCRG